MSVAEFYLTGEKNPEDRHRTKRGLLYNNCSRSAKQA